jgi:hypothetical protein
VVQSPVGLPGQVETWDEQKWVRQMKLAQLAPDAELEDLARRHLVREMGEKGDQ